MHPKEQIFNVFESYNPDPKIELNYLNTYTLLVAVVLSARTTDKVVNKATNSLFKKVSLPAHMINLGEDGLKKYIKIIGLFNTKAKHIIELTKKLIQDFNGEVPNTLEKLMSLPGVGRKSANVVLNSAFGIPSIGVDTHVFRVSNRIGLTHSKTTLQTEKQLMESTPKKWLKKIHHWLVLHGRYICKSQKPLCDQCKIKEYCDFYNTKST